MAKIKDMTVPRWQTSKNLKNVYIKINRDIDDYQDRKQDAYLKAIEENQKNKSKTKR